jgi:hypoxanthine phosphoribosyltransferase
VATLLFKPFALKADVPVDYIGVQIPNDFVVGYGLDYNGLGRNLRDIYQLVE